MAAISQPRRPTRRAELVTVLRQRIVSRMHLGILRRGDRLPSVRVAAKEFGVDPRVVLAAYREMERDELVTLRRRSGVFVGSPGDSPANADRLREAKHSDWLIDQAAEALRRDISVPAFADYARRALTGRQLRAVVLERNDDQLWSTTDELRRDYGFEADGIDLDCLEGDTLLPAAIRRADLLVTTSRGAEIRDLAARADVPLCTLTMCPGLFDEVRRLLVDQSVYFIVSDHRFAARVRKLIGGNRARPHFHVLVYGTDDLGDIPDDAPLYLTRLVRHRIQAEMLTTGSHERVPTTQNADCPLLSRVLPDARVFSPESARELLSFVIHSNIEPAGAGLNAFKLTG